MSSSEHICLFFLLINSVYIQDKSNESYRPVTTERFHTSIEQSKAMEYVGHEVVFF